MKKIEKRVKKLEEDCVTGQEILAVFTVVVILAGSLFLTGYVAHNAGYHTGYNKGYKDCKQDVKP